MLRAAEELGYRWVVFGRNEREHFGDRSDRILSLLREAGELRAAFPVERPDAFVFELPVKARVYRPGE